jgi:hypothetical protein
MRFFLSLIVLALVIGSAVPALAQPEVDIARRKAAAAGHPIEPMRFRHLGESEVRAIAAQAAKGANGDPDRFEELATHAVLTLVPSFSIRPIVEGFDFGLDISVVGPVGSFLSGVRESIRKMEPIGHPSWPTYVSVIVKASTIEAPDIEKVVISRNGSIATPLQILLFPQRLTTAMGASVVVHQGVVTYPLSAFDPGASVVLTAIPTTGHNIVATISQDDLRKIQ